ncbi:MAG: MarR family transcriptional regulator [Chloroflexi bacterium]|nr:MarR family transcriptional regulator [Chloroflexota bacterium]
MGDTNISDYSEHPAASDRIEQVLGVFERFMNGMMSSHAPEFADIGVTMAQAKVLYVLAAAEALRMSELAMRLGVSTSTASGAVDRLVDLGLIERRADPSDRRQVFVAVTPAGADVLERMRELNTRQMRDLLVRLTPDGLAAVERAITVLSQAAGVDASRADQTPEGEPT